MIPKKPLLRNRGLLPADSQVQKPEFTDVQRNCRDSAARRRSKMHPHLFVLHDSSLGNQDDLKSLTNIDIGYF
jgi:hypothetical protein